MEETWLSRQRHLSPSTPSAPEPLSKCSPRLARKMQDREQCHHAARLASALAALLAHTAHRPSWNVLQGQIPKLLPCPSSHSWGPSIPP